MKIKSFSMAAAAIPALVLIALGCGTSSKSLRWEDVGLGHKTLTEGDMKVSARYLDSKALGTIHTSPYNPFTEYPAELFVVDVTIETVSPVEVRAGEAVLATASAKKSPVAKEELKSLWNSTLASNSQSRGGGPNRYSGWSYSYVEDLIERAVLPGAVSVQAGGKVSGYVLFDSSHGDKKKPATFTLPVVDAQGGPIGEFKFDFQL